MAAKKRSNVTSSEGTGILSRRLTRLTKEEQDKLFNFSRRSKRNAKYRAAYLDTIEKTANGFIYESKYYDLLSVLKQAVHGTNNDKKHGISQEDLKSLSELTETELLTVFNKLNEILQSGGNLKAVLQELLPDHKMKVTVTLPANVNQWYTEQAKAKGMSKSAFLSLVIGKYCEENRNIQKQ